MAAEDAVPYGIAIGRSIWNYFRLSDYLRVKINATLHGETVYDNVGELWKDAQQGSVNSEGKKKVSPGRVVKLIDFDFTEWFPWTPGQYWTPYGRALRYAAEQHPERSARVLKRLNARLDDIDYGDILSPMGKSITVLSGVGAIRTKMRRIDGEMVKIVGASSPTGTYAFEERGMANVSAGIPVLMNKRAYDHIRERIERHGVARASLEGVFAEIPEHVENAFQRAQGTPRYCIFVGSGRNISDFRYADKTLSSGWSIFEDKNGGYKFSFCSFEVANPDGRREAARFIEEYIAAHGGNPLTEFDEIENHLGVRYPLTQVVDNRLDMGKLRELANKIRKKYRL